MRRILAPAAGARRDRHACVDSGAMCGIVGYVGDKQAQGVVIEGLRRLEYRGYDSAGIALVDTSEGAGRIASDKRKGKLANLEKAIVETPLPASTTGIGHTRWATHGAPNDENAHPHLGRTGRVAVVHNGIIENYATLRTGLENAGHEMLSETDTEIAAHLLELEVQGGADLTTAMQRVCQRLEGAFTLVAVDGQDPSRVVAARRNSPLVVGLGEGENFIGSDVAAFIEHTREALELGQDQVVTITRDGVEVTGFDGSPAEGERYHVDWDLSAAEKDGFDWFMRKEIFEQPRAVADAHARTARRHRQAPARRGPPVRGRAAHRRQDHHRRLRHRQLRRTRRQVRHRALDPHPLRGRARPRVPLPRPDPDPRHARRRDEPVGGDGRHPDGDPPRPRAGLPRARDLQHQRLDDPARVRRRDLHPRRPRDRCRVDQGLPHPAHRLLPARAVPRPGARHEVRRRDLPRARRAGQDARPRPDGARPRRRHLRAGRPARRDPCRCSSSAATPASRSRSRVRSS